MDIAVPTRIVSEEPGIVPNSIRFPADYPILMDFYIGPTPSTRGSQGVPAYRVVHLMSSFKITFPIKAPTRQMLYPLSYRGLTFKAPGC